MGVWWEIQSQQRWGVFFMTARELSFCIFLIQWAYVLLIEQRQKHYRFVFMTPIPQICLQLWWKRFGVGLGGYFKSFLGLCRYGRGWDLSLCMLKQVQIWWQSCWQKRLLLYFIGVSSWSAFITGCTLFWVACWQPSFILLFYWCIAMNKFCYYSK